MDHLSSIQSIKNDNHLPNEENVRTQTFLSLLFTVRTLTETEVVFPFYWDLMKIQKLYLFALPSNESLPMFKSLSDLIQDNVFASGGSLVMSRGSKLLNSEFFFH